MTSIQLREMSRYSMHWPMTVLSGLYKTLAIRLVFRSILLEQIWFRYLQFFLVRHTALVLDIGEFS